MNKKILYPMDDKSKRLFFSFLAKHGALTKYKLNRNIYLQKKYLMRNVTFVINVVTHVCIVFQVTMR